MLDLGKLVMDGCSIARAYVPSIWMEQQASQGKTPQQKRADKDKRDCEKCGRGYATLVYGSPGCKYLCGYCVGERRAVEPTITIYRGK